MRLLCATGLCAVLSTLLPAPAGLAADEGARGLAVETFLDFEDVRDPQLSPDGSEIVYTRRWVNTMKDQWDSSLWIMNADGTKNRFLVDGAGVRWSPDGTRIAYLAQADPQGQQIFVRWMDDEGATSQVTRLHEEPSNLRWSPDGQSIAFTLPVLVEPSWKVEMPSAPKGAEWTEPPRIIEDMHYRQDRRGFYEHAWTHLFVVPADGGTPRQLTEGEWHVGARPYGLAFQVGFDWTPDGRFIVFDALREEGADRRYRESHLYAIDVAGREVRQITSRKGPWTQPRVSPDGAKVAFTGFEWTDQSYKATELYVANLDGSDVRPISGDIDRDIEQLFWSPSGDRIYFTVEDRGSSNVYETTLQGEVRALTEGAHVVTLGSISRSGLAVGVRSTMQQPRDVVTFRLAEPRELLQLTRVNDDILMDVELGEVEEIWYESTGNTRVQGWIVKPPDFDRTAKYPMILHIHGGPHAMYDVGFKASFQTFAADGYVVLYTNPRGSTGYGTAFGNAIDKAYPSVDYDDLMAGVDELISRGYVDPERLYVTGVSGGGVLSSWIIGHTDVFAAAAVRAPVTNWMSFAGTTDIVGWGYQRFRPPFWEDPAPWLEHSPIMYVDNVTTPTLLMTGELDLRTPMGQTEEYFAALKALGVPAVMMRFNGEYHGTGSKPSNWMRTQLYLMSWFEKHRRGEGAVQPASR